MNYKEITFEKHLFPKLDNKILKLDQNKISDNLSKKDVELLDTLKFKAPEILSE